MTANHPSPLLPRLMQAGMTALQAGDLDGALLQFGAARRIAPTDPGLLRSLAALYQHAARWGDLWSVAETGLALHPDDAGFSIARIAALTGAGFSAAALTLAQAQSRVTPDDPQLAQHHGNLLLQSGDAVAALQIGKTALARHPDMAALLGMAAEAAFRLGDHAAARGWLDHAVRLEPQNRTLRMARASMLLSLGDWAPGLADYEYRLLPDATREIVRRDLHIPRWQGEDLRQRCLLVVSEQGVGDQMRFLRDIIALQPLCGRMIVECAARLVPLLRRSLPEAIAVVAAEEQRDGRRHVFDYGWLASQSHGMGGADFYIEMGSIMLRLFERGVTPER